MRRYPSPARPSNLSLNDPYMLAAHTPGRQSGKSRQANLEKQEEGHMPLVRSRRLMRVCEFPIYCEPTLSNCGEALKPTTTAASMQVRCADGVTAIGWL